MGRTSIPTPEVVADLRLPTIGETTFYSQTAHQSAYHYVNMAHSYSALYVHLVFATKGRLALLSDAKTRMDMHSYLGGICKDLGCPTFIVGGVADHVHIVANQGRTIAIAHTVQELKKASICWMKDNGHMKFGWQDGYGAFSFGKDDLPRLVQYVGNQEEHHKKVSLDDEYRALLIEAGIPFDDKYLWG